MVRFFVQGGVAMSSRLLADELWSEIENFFPKRRRVPLLACPAVPTLQAM